MTSDTSCLTLAVLQDARTMQTKDGARMIRDAARTVSKSVARLLHVRHAAIGHPTAG